jgi:hypothetical protein
MIVTTGIICYTLLFAVARMESFTFSGHGRIYTAKAILTSYQKIYCVVIEKRSAQEGSGLVCGKQRLQNSVYLVIRRFLFRPLT